MQLFALNQSNNAETARNARGGLYLEQQYITCFPLLCRGAPIFYWCARRGRGGIENGRFVELFLKLKVLFQSLLEAAEAST